MTFSSFSPRSGSGPAKSLTEISLHRRCPDALRLRFVRPTGSLTCTFTCNLVRISRVTSAFAVITRKRFACESAACYVLFCSYTYRLLPQVLFTQPRRPQPITSVARAHLLAYP